VNKWIEPERIIGLDDSIIPHEKYKDIKSIRFWIDGDKEFGAVGKDFRKSARQDAPFWIKPSGKKNDMNFDQNPL